LCLLAARDRCLDTERTRGVIWAGLKTGPYEERIAAGVDIMHASSTSSTATPITLAELELLKKTVLFDQEDVKQLRLSRDVLEDQTEAILDVWYGFVGSHPHLLHYFSNASDGQPNAAYLTATRVRFGQWILDTAAAEYDERWLAYQFEIGRRHHRIGKNRADGVAAVDHIHYRYLPALIVPITTTLKPFLAKKGHPAAEVDRMHAAWVKSITLQVVLWSYPYCREGDF
jgi:hypothetical protein